MGQSLYQLTSTWFRRQDFTETTAPTHPRQSDPESRCRSAELSGKTEITKKMPTNDEINGGEAMAHPEQEMSSESRTIMARTGVPESEEYRKMISGLP